MACENCDHLKAEVARLRQILAEILPIAESHAASLEAAFDETDDGGAYHDWQDVLTVINRARENTPK